MSETIALASSYATLVHELTDWTGAKHRLDREFGKRFGDQAYAAEELVAEIGAARRKRGPTTRSTLRSGSRS